ncbi:MAG: signal recognition particle-docking protein FtsY [Gammaproteobacteria bacterium]|nr:signal recognition particle-docking protein FtsY [Gammaproteobacteria bacterium]
MFGFKKKTEEQGPEQGQEEEKKPGLFARQNKEEEERPEEIPDQPKKPGVFARLSKGEKPREEIPDQPKKPGLFARLSKEEEPQEEIPDQPKKPGLFARLSKEEEPQEEIPDQPKKPGLFARLSKEKEEEPQEEIPDQPKKPGLFARLSKGEEAQEEDPDQPKKPGMFARLKQGLSRTRSGLTEGLAKLVLGKKAIDDELLEEVETLLLQADVGIEATQTMIADLTARISRKQLADADALFQALHEDMQAILMPVEQAWQIPADASGPFVILMIGINGAGKTTTIGKLAKRFQEEGRSVMLAAGDTFRAAAVEQLQVWGERNEVPVIAQQSGADSASVIYDAVNAATARKIDILIADTAGRLHTQGNLMEELKKVHRVMGKINPGAPHEVMLIVDATTGQNALNQAKTFHESIGLTGITITKLDGTAKGGIVFAIAKQLGIPIRFIGIGEQIDDLRIFEAKAFVDALLARE